MAMTPNGKPCKAREHPFYCGYFLLQKRQHTRYSGIGILEFTRSVTPGSPSVFTTNVVGEGLGLRVALSVALSVGGGVGAVAPVQEKSIIRVQSD